MSRKSISLNMVPSSKGALTRKERLASGKALRNEFPRTSHADWQEPNNRKDPIDLLSESNQGRIPQLIPIRYGRMMQSPFAFYRGAAAIMAADLASTPTSGISVQACGDCHLMNFGGLLLRNGASNLTSMILTRPFRLLGNGISKDWRPVLSSPDAITGSKKRRRRKWLCDACKVTANTCKIMLRRAFCTCGMSELIPRLSSHRSDQESGK